MPLGNGLTTPQTDWQQAQAKSQQAQVKAQRKAARKQMKKFERESMRMGLEHAPTASAYTEADRNTQFGFDPPPDVPEYTGIPGGPFSPPIQPGAVDPATGFRGFPINPNTMSPIQQAGPTARPDWEAYLRDQATRGRYRPPSPLPPGFGFQPPKEQLPATKVYSAPIGPLGPPGGGFPPRPVPPPRRPQPQG